MKKSEDSQWDLWDIIKQANKNIMEFTEVVVKQKGQISYMK